MYMDLRFEKLKSDLKALRAENERLRSELSVMLAVVLAIEGSWDFERCCAVADAVLALERSKSVEKC